MESWRFALISFAADILGILAFFGAADYRAARIALGGAFAGIAVIVGGVDLWQSARLFFSPRGAYYPVAYHRKRVAAGLAVLILSLFLGAVVLHLATTAPPTTR